MDCFVLDCSVAIAWSFKDEATQSTSSILRSLSSGSGAVVPSVWPLEVMNVLLVAERNNRITKQETKEIISILGELPIEVEEPLILTDGFLALAREHKLTSYDASYIELALRRGLPIATLDKLIQKAAKKLNLKLVCS